MKNFFKFAAIVVGLAMLYFAYKAYQLEQDTATGISGFFSALTKAPGALWSWFTGIFSGTGGSSSGNNGLQAATATYQSIGVNTSTPQGQQDVNSAAAAGVDPGLSTAGIGLDPDGSLDPFANLAQGGGTVDPSSQQFALSVPNQ